jgi:hypothetical protein
VQRKGLEDVSNVVSKIKDTLKDVKIEDFANPGKIAEIIPIILEFELSLYKNNATEPTELSNVLIAKSKPPREHYS